MRVRLNGWQRIGIVFSVIWAIVGYLLSNAGHHDMTAAEFARYGYLFCPEHLTPQGNCSDEFISNYHAMADGHWVDAVIISLAPIPFAWLVVYTLIGIWRWIRRGFNI